MTKTYREVEPGVYLPTGKATTHEMARIKSEPYLVAGQRVAGQRVTHSVTSGFCIQVYSGRVIKVMNRESLVVFDDGREYWVDNEYLRPEAK